MGPTRLLMWDIDQTLCETRPLGSQSIIAALTALTGTPFQGRLDLHGRTDRYTCAEALAAQGINDPEPYFEKFFALLEAEFLARAHLLPGTHGPLPGVPAVLARLAAYPHIAQTVVTGNIPAVARAKTAAFDLARHLDFEIGGYGTDDQVRATLVRRSRERAEARYGYPFGEVLVIGDTPHDVAAALANGVTAIGVATGASTAADLRAAGAHAVLDSLADVPAAVEILAT
ncbi:MAG TPA: HAD hydrolase-like protein [Rugosimonospora sp.]|nr:HAD hydrolase-like protein [Rugosimonospora sp.]